MLDEEESIESQIPITASRFQFSKPSGRLLSSDTFELFQEAVRDDQIFDRHDVLEKEQNLVDQTTKLQNPVPNTVQQFSEEGRIEEASDLRHNTSKHEEASTSLLRFIDQSAHTSSLQVRPIHLSVQQGRSWNVLSGVHTLVSGPEGSMIVPSKMFLN